jgi:hypothetical protein
MIKTIFIVKKIEMKYVADNFPKTENFSVEDI